MPCRRRLVEDPGTKAVVLVPSVPLVDQQVGMFIRAGFNGSGPGCPQALSGPALVDGFSSDKQLSVTTWARESERLSVVVATAQSFVNVLNAGVADLGQLDVLVSWVDACIHKGCIIVRTIMGDAYHGPSLYYHGGCMNIVIVRTIMGDAWGINVLSWSCYGGCPA